MPHGAGSKRRKLEARAQAQNGWASRPQQNGCGSRPQQNERTSQSKKNGYQNGGDTSKPTAVFKPTKGRDYTVSVALPSSIVANCQSHELKTLLIGQIARALAVFSVDEMVIFSDDGNASQSSSDPSSATSLMQHVLSYLECPPYLRRALFPMHPALRTAGALPPLDIPSHLKQHEYCPYREGVAVGPASGNGTLVDVGFPERVTVIDEVPEGARLTVRLPDWLKDRKPRKGEEIQGEAVAPGIPREEGGWYWGYEVRLAGSLSSVFTEATWEGGYDVSIGTSERGRALTEVVTGEEGDSGFPKGWKHLIVVFGGVAGLEHALSADEELKATGLNDVSELFDYWVNLVPGQGSRTIRTEEAVWLGLMGLREVVAAKDR